MEKEVEEREKRACELMVRVCASGNPRSPPEIPFKWQAHSLE